MKFEKKSNLFKFFADNNLCSDEILDILRYDIFGNMYYYGDHFKLNNEENRTNQRKQMIKVAKYIFFFKSKIFFDKNTNDKVLSNAYHGLSEELTKIGFNTFVPPWQVSRTVNFIPNYQVFDYCNLVANDLGNKPFNYLISDVFIDRITKLSVILEDFFLKENIKTVIFPQDLSFFENLSLKIFEKIAKPSFIFLHGLPGRYNGIDDNRAKYLMVWGQKIKDLYIESGVNSNKIITTGHPIYSGLKVPEKLRNKIDNILVLTQSIPGKCDSGNIPICDRSNLIYYLYSIKKILTKLGVSKVRLRCHPGENINWYLTYVDRDFFIPETKNSIKEALLKSTLVIGPTSTVLLEAIYQGVNYIVYEPLVESGKNLINQCLVPPFDRSDDRIPIAHNEDELQQFIMEKYLVDTSFVENYIAPKFDISVLKEIVG